MQKDLETLKAEYLQNNTSYKVEQKLLNESSKEELKSIITIISFSHTMIKTGYYLKLNKLKKTSNYTNGNEIDRLFLCLYLSTFYGGNEVVEKSKILNRLQNFYVLNHTDFLERNNYEQIDISSISIIDIINIYIRIPDNLRRNIKCPLPSHRDSTASFHVYICTHSWYCFGCKKGGNTVNFVAEMEDISTTEAYKKIIKLIQ